MKTIKLLFIFLLAYGQLEAQTMLDRFKYNRNLTAPKTNQKAVQGGILSGFTPFYEIPERPDSVDYYMLFQSTNPTPLGRFQVTYIGNTNRVQQLDFYVPGTQILGARLAYTYNAQQKLTSTVISESDGLGGALLPIERQIYNYDAQNNLVSYKYDSISNGNWVTYQGDSLAIVYSGNTPTTITYLMFNDFNSAWDVNVRFANLTFNAAGEITSFVEQYPGFTPNTFETSGRFTNLQWGHGWPGLFPFATGVYNDQDDLGAFLVPRKQEREDLPTAFLYELTFDGINFQNFERRTPTIVGGQVTETLDQYWITSWENDIKITYQYANGKIVQELEASWDGTTYEDEYLANFFFDQSNQYRGFRGYLFQNGIPNMEYRDSSIINYVGTAVKSFSYFMEFGGLPFSLDSIVYNPGSSVNVPTNILANSIKTFPNPTKGQVSLFLGADVEPGNYNISLFDLSGKMVSQKSLFLNSNQTELLDFSNFKTGIYLLKVNGTQGFFHQKLIIQE